MYARPLKAKTADETLRAFRSIFKEAGQKNIPKYLQADQDE